MKGQLDENEVPPEEWEAERQTQAFSPTLAGKSRAPEGCERKNQLPFSQELGRPVWGGKVRCQLGATQDWGKGLVNSASVPVGSRRACSPPRLGGQYRTRTIALQRLLCMPNSENHFPRVT